MPSDDDRGGYVRAGRGERQERILAALADQPSTDHELHELMPDCSLKTIQNTLDRLKGKAVRKTTQARQGRRVWELLGGQPTPQPRAAPPPPVRRPPASASVVARNVAAAHVERDMQQPDMMETIAALFRERDRLRAVLAGVDETKRKLEQVEAEIPQRLAQIATGLPVPAPARDDDY